MCIFDIIFFFEGWFSGYDFYLCFFRGEGGFRKEVFCFFG